VPLVIQYRLRSVKSVRKTVRLHCANSSPVSSHIRAGEYECRYYTVCQTLNCANRQRICRREIASVLSAFARAIVRALAQLRETWMKFWDDYNKQPSRPYCLIAPFRVTWRHRSRDHLIACMPFPIGSTLERSLSQAVFEILRSKRIGVTSSIFQVTWCHRSRDHLIAHMPCPIGGPLEPSLYL